VTKNFFQTHILRRLEKESGEEVWVNRKFTEVIGGTCWQTRRNIMVFTLLHIIQIRPNESICLRQYFPFKKKLMNWNRVHRISENLCATSKFFMPVGWHEGSFRLRIYKYLAPPYKIQWPRRFCAGDLCVPELRCPVYSESFNTISLIEHKLRICPRGNMVFIPH
jgi:hypothetical protein